MVIVKYALFERYCMYKYGYRRYCRESTGWQLSSPLILARPAVMKLRMTKQSLNDPVVFRLIVAKNDSKNNGIDIKTTLIQFVGTWWSIYFNWGAVSFSLRITKSQFVAVHELPLPIAIQCCISLHFSWRWCIPNIYEKNRPHKRIHQVQTCWLPNDQS